MVSHTVVGKITYSKKLKADGPGVPPLTRLCRAGESSICSRSFPILLLNAWRVTDVEACMGISREVTHRLTRQGHCTGILNSPLS